jgi:hypothetical protein
MRRRWTSGADLDRWTSPPSASGSTATVHCWCPRPTPRDTTSSCGTPRRAADYGSRTSAMTRAWRSPAVARDRAKPSTPANNIRWPTIPSVFRSGKSGWPGPAKSTAWTMSAGTRMSAPTTQDSPVGRTSRSRASHAPLSVATGWSGHDMVTRARVGTGRSRRNAVRAQDRPCGQPQGGARLAPWTD